MVPDRAPRRKVKHLPGEMLVPDRAPKKGAREQGRKVPMQQGSKEGVII